MLCTLYAGWNIWKLNFSSGQNWKNVWHRKNIRDFSLHCQKNSVCWYVSVSFVIQCCWSLFFSPSFSIIFFLTECTFLEYFGIFWCNFLISVKYISMYRFQTVIDNAIGKPKRMNVIYNVCMKKVFNNIKIHILLQLQLHFIFRCCFYFLFLFFFRYEMKNQDKKKTQYKALPKKKFARVLRRRAQKRRRKIREKCISTS